MLSFPIVRFKILLGMVLLFSTTVKVALIIFYAKLRVIKFVLFVAWGKVRFIP